VLERDLLFSSGIESAVRKHGFDVRIATSSKALSQVAERKPSLVIVNLDDINDFVALKMLKEKNECCRFVGYYSHVNAGTAEQAMNTGFETVLPRRAFVGKLSEILDDV